MPVGTGSSLLSKIGVSKTRLTFSVYSDLPDLISGYKGTSMGGKGGKGRKRREGRG